MSNVTLQGLNRAGSYTITGAWSFSSAITSTVTTGTAPFTIASTTLVTNLNANYLQGINLANMDLNQILTNANTSSGVGMQMTTSDKIEFRSTSNFIHSNATAELTITSPKVNMADGFWVALPGAGQKSAAFQVSGVTALTGQYFDQATEDVQFWRNNGLAFSISLAASTTTRGTLKCINNITMPDNKGLLLGNGTDAVIYFNGTDLIVDSNFTGSGGLNLAGQAHTAIGAETLTGYVTIKVAGTNRKFAIVS